MNKVLALQSLILNCSLRKTKISAPGKEPICYIMVNHLSDLSEDILLELCDKVREGRTLSHSWKEAVVVPTDKLKKDCKTQAIIDQFL